MRLVWILGDQLIPEHPLLEAPEDSLRVGLIEAAPRARQLRYHQQKLALLYAAMRHHAAALRRRGFTVLYRHLEDPPEGADFEAVLSSWIREHGIRRIDLLEPNDYDSQQGMGGLGRRLGVPLTLHPSPQFLLPRADFAAWAEGRKRLLMETHYRGMRQRHGLLMTPDGEPEGDQWNFDAENRRTVREFQRERPSVPPLPDLPADPVLETVTELVGRRFSDHPGRAADLWLPATREGARSWLERFIAERLPAFGPWEDVMVQGQRVLFHSVLSPLLNIGLLTPMECLEAAEAAWRQGRAPLASVEGFIRQILGWREFIHGLYWLRMPAYRESNALEADRPLPRWAYNGSTEMACVAEAIGTALSHGYNHHIQRLMVLGNYFLLAGHAPKEVLRWYSEMYIDAYDWVMVPNVLGMVLHADGGLVATKPYSAGPPYLAKMGNACGECRYNPRKKEGPDACPFHALYWSFQGRHADRFRSNPRMAMMVRQWEKKPAAEQAELRQRAERFLDAQA